jgi:hypothetical protein
MPLSLRSFRLEAEFSESGPDQFQSEDQMLTIRRLLINPIICVIGGWLLGILPSSVRAQQPQQLAPVNVEARPYGEQLIGPYNQPRWSARGRFSANTDVYVLPPFSFYLDLDYHGTFPRVGKSDHLFTQELELGLPYRFQLAFELDEEHQNGRSQIPFTTIEGRWALANWGKIPLNPTLLVEYDIGTGKQYPVQPGQNAEQEGAAIRLGMSFASRRVYPIHTNCGYYWGRKLAHPSNLPVTFFLIKIFGLTGSARSVFQRRVHLPSGAKL